MIKTLVILLSCTATARACESPDQEGGRGKATIIGGIAGAAVLPTFLLAIGLTPAGPVAGGWFAASQGAGVAAGSWMASWQSMAMFGSLAKSLTVGAGFAATGGRLARHAGHRCARHRHGYSQVVRRAGRG